MPWLMARERNRCQPAEQWPYQAVMYRHNHIILFIDLAVMTSDSEYAADGIAPVCIASERRAHDARLLVTMKRKL